MTNATRTSLSSGELMLQEMLEYANFPSRTQRYIARSLAVFAGAARACAERSVSEVESRSIMAQAQVYEALRAVGEEVPAPHATSSSERFYVTLLASALFDINEGQLPSFAAFRFLYERLLGAAARPWLLSAFCAAAAHPATKASHRPFLIAGAADHGDEEWSPRQPLYSPERPA